MSTALRVMEAPQAYRKELELFSDDAGAECHSLHYGMPMPESMRPEIPSWCIAKFSQKGGVVLDPFSRGGATALEASLAGRVAFASDTDPLSMRITAAKLSPADITEVTLRLQMANLRLPVSLDVYRKTFSSFYETSTYREILNMKNFIASKNDRVSRFIEYICLGLLHGHSAGYLSVYTFPQIAISAEDQELLNIKRRQNPDYRAIVPRVLRKTASILRDGLPSVLGQMESKTRLALADPRNLSYVKSENVDLVVTAPPLPGVPDYTDGHWIRHWFSGIVVKPENKQTQFSSLQVWIDFMNEVLLESARVVRGGGRTVLALGEVKLGNEMVALDEQLSTLVEEHLGRYWDVEGLLINRPKADKVRNAASTRDSSGSSRRNRLLVLRRR